MRTKLRLFGEAEMAVWFQETVAAVSLLVFVVSALVLATVADAWLA